MRQKKRIKIIFRLGLYFERVTLKGLWVQCFDILLHTHFIDDCCPQVTINDRGVCACACVHICVWRLLFVLV